MDIFERVQKVGNSMAVRIPKAILEGGHSRPSESLNRKVALPEIAMVGHAAMINPSEQRIDEYLMREAFVQNYCEQQGLDINNLSIGQALEVRSQAGWQDPIS